MNIAAFYAMVSQSLKRGTTLDSVIPTRAAMACTWMERNYTFQYMQQFRLWQGQASDRVLKLPTNSLIKSVKFVRLVNSDGTYTNLNKIEPEDLLALRTASNGQIKSTRTVVPQAYWMSGISDLVFDCIPSSDINGEAMFYEYSAWPQDTNDTHPLVTIAADVLEQQTLLLMAAYLRDPKMVEAYKLLRDESLNTLTRAEDDTKYGGESITMAYSGSR